MVGLAPNVATQQTDSELCENGVFSGLACVMRHKSEQAWLCAKVLGFWRKIDDRLADGWVEDGI